LKKVKKFKKLLPKDENFGIVIHQCPWVLAKVSLFKFLTKFIYKIWIIYIENGENSKKFLKKTVTKRWNFSNLKTLISYEYCPFCFFWNGQPFLYIQYELYKL